MLLGVILGVLLVMPSFNARGRTVKNLRDEIKQLQDEKSKTAGGPESDKGPAKNS